MDAVPPPRPGPGGSRRSVECSVQGDCSSRSPTATPTSLSCGATPAEHPLRRHFGDVQRDALDTRAVFPDHTSAIAYLASSQEDVAWDLPWFDGPREYAGPVTVFVCR